MERQKIHCGRFPAQLDTDGDITRLRVHVSQSWGDRPSPYLPIEIKDARLLRRVTLRSLMLNRGWGHLYA